MTLFPQQRRDSSHNGWHRQLPALGLAASLWLAWGVGESRAAEPKAQATQAEALRAQEAVREEVNGAKLMEAAFYARQAGPAEWKKMEKVYTDLEAKYPRNAEVKNARAEFSWSMGDHDLAVRTWEEAVEIEPTNDEVLEHLGGSMLAAGDVKKSAAYYVRAVASAPQNAAYAFTLANVTFLFRHELIDTQHPDENAVLARSLALFAEASRLEPLNINYARAYAETFYSLPKPDWKAGLAAWQHFAEISPQTDFAQANLARVYLKLGQKEAARACLEKIQGADYQRLKAKLAERIETE